MVTPTRPAAETRGRERKRTRERFRRGFRARPRAGGRCRASRRWPPSGRRRRCPRRTRRASGADGGGSLFAFAGGGGAIGSRRRRPRAGPRRPEMGLMFWDEDMATAADAATKPPRWRLPRRARARRAPSRRLRGALAPGRRVSALGGGRRRWETARERETPSTPTKDLAAAGRSMLKGDARVGDGELRVGDARRQGEGEGGGDVPQADKAKTAVDAVKEHLAEEEDRRARPRRTRTALRGRRGASTAVRDDDDDDVDDARGKPAKKENASSKLGFSMLTSRTTANAARPAAPRARPGRTPRRPRRLFRTASRWLRRGPPRRAWSSADEIRASTAKRQGLRGVDV